MYISRPAKAESFLSPVLCFVGNLVKRECRQAPTTQPTPSEPAPSEPQTIAPSGPMVTPPLEIEPAPLTPIEPLPEVRGATMNVATYDFPAHVMMATSSFAPPVTTSSLMLESSDQGWKILGVAWYWWLLSVVGLVALTRASQLYISQKSLS